MTQTCHASGVNPFYPRYRYCGVSGKRHSSEIVQQYPSLSPADVYQVIGYRLRHAAELEVYLASHRAARHAARELNEFNFPPDGIRDRLLARRRQALALRWLADENFNNDILRAPFRRNPTLDIVRVQDVGLSGVDDPTLLA